jgi:hypothetical protein
MLGPQVVLSKPSMKFLPLFIEASLKNLVVIAQTSVSITVTTVPSLS